MLAVLDKKGKEREEKKVVCCSPFYVNWSITEVASMSEQDASPYEIKINGEVCWFFRATASIIHVGHVRSVHGVTSVNATSTDILTFECRCRVIIPHETVWFHFVSYFCLLYFLLYRFSLLSYWKIFILLSSTWRPNHPKSVYVIMCKAPGICCRVNPNCSLQTFVNIASMRPQNTSFFQSNDDFCWVFRVLRRREVSTLAMSKLSTELQT